jgi:hypothetical protein
LRNGAPTPDLEWQLAMYRAVEGQNDEATALLRRAVDGGSLPDGDGLALDIAEEPCFKGLVGRADFQAIRRRIFERLAQERAKVPQPLLAQLYPISSRAAA